MLDFSQNHLNFILDITEDNKVILDNFLSINMRIHNPKKANGVLFPRCIFAGKIPTTTILQSIPAARVVRLCNIILIIILRMKQEKN